MPYTKPDTNTTAKESYRIISIQINLTEKQIQINLRKVSYDVNGLPVVEDLTYFIKNNRTVYVPNKAPEVTQDFDDLAGATTGGSSLYDEIKTVLYNQLVAQEDIPDTDWTIE